jgi:hypothetical protein
MEEASDESFLLPAKNRRRRGYRKQAGSLCSIGPPDRRTISQSHPGSYAVRYSTTPPLRYSTLGSRPHSRAISCTHSSSTFRY